MNTPTYKEQFDKITEAYIRGEIKPFNSTFCFCGTLAPEEYSNEGFKNWNDHDGRFNQKKHFYSLEQYGDMEEALFSALGAYTGRMSSFIKPCLESDEYEDVLFNGMCAALEVLKQIHISKGEVIDETPKFTKRELSKIQ